jgi:hypothetical protein
MTHIATQKLQAVYRPARFDPESKALYYITNDGTEFTRLKKYELASGSHRDIERADWDIQSTEFSHNSKYRVSTINADGTTVIRIGVNIFGVANWVRTLESLPPYWESFREPLYQEIGHPQCDRAMLEAISPLLHNSKIRMP